MCVAGNFQKCTVLFVVIHSLVKHRDISDLDLCIHKSKLHSSSKDRQTDRQIYLFDQMGKNKTN